MLTSARFFSSAPRVSRTCARRVPGVTSRQTLLATRTSLCVNHNRSYCAAVSEPEPSAELSQNVRDVLDKLKSLNFMEIMTLGKELEKLTGVSQEQLMGQMAAGGAAAAGAAAPAAAQAAPAEAAPEAAAPSSKEITCADIKLISFPEGNKFHVLKEIRKLKPGMNLMDSKKLVENLPQILQNRVSGEELEEWKKALDAVSAQYELIA